MADRPEPAVEARQLTEHGRERKQQLVDAALALFSEHGYNATRISDICERAGVAKGLFYWYFPTKHDLFGEIVRSMRQRLRRAQGSAMRPDDDPLTRLRDGTVASVRFLAEHAAFFELIDVQRADPAVRDILRADTKVYVDDVIALVREAQDAGLVVDVDPKVLATGVLGAVSAFSSAWRSGRLSTDPDELSELVGDWVARAMGG